jgi:hypothetical protein
MTIRLVRRVGLVFVATGLTCCYMACCGAPLTSGVRRRSRIVAMKGKTFSVGCLVLLVAAVVWLSVSSPSRRPGADIPVTLIGYTNDVTGILTAPRFRQTNIEHSKFAVFRIRNPTRRDFFCYIGPAFWEGGQTETHLSQSGDFDLPPGTGATFAVPVPETPKAWRCGVWLCHRYNYPRWKFELVRLAERCGLELDSSEPSWFAVSSEISQ